MSSQIESIIDAIKAWTPTWDSDTPVSINTMDINEMPVKLDETDCPVRVFLAFDPKNTSEFAYIALGTTASIDWFILDRLYITPIKMEMGLAGNNARIYQYSASYHEQSRLNRSLGLNGVTVKNVSITPPYQRNWPEGEGGIPFYVVDCVVHVFEVLT